VRDHLTLDGHGLAHPLLEQFGQAVATFELRLGNRVKVGTEGRERLELAELL